MGIYEIGRREGIGKQKKKLIFRKGTLEDGINGLLLKMERFSHPCDRGEFAHLLSAKKCELADLEECLNKLSYE